MYQEIKTEVVVIGSGPAGYSAAFRCSDLGLDTTLVEFHENLGGVCLNVGCIPSKSLLHIAKVIKEAEELSKLGVFFKSPTLDLEKIQNWKKNIINQFSNSLLKMAKHRKINTIFGKACFSSTNSLLVEHNKNSYVISFKNAIIATGSHPIEIPSLPNKDDRIWNSTDALSFKKVPNQLLIVGGGIIGLEMATIYSALKSKVDIVDRFNTFLPVLDEDISAIYLKSINDRFNVFLNTHVKSIQPEEKGLFVTLGKEDNEEKDLYYDNVLVAIGRKPNIEYLNLNDIGIKLNEFGFIEVNTQLKTNISHIYAVGDVTGFPMLAHKAIHEAHIAAEVICGKNHYFEPKVIPSIAYTDPEISWVGLSEKEAKNQNIDYEIAKFPWNASGRAHASNSMSGITKLIFNKENNQIIGGSIVGTNASELISEIGLAIEMGCDAEDIALTIHPHPTLSESISLCAEVFQGTVTDVLNLKKHNS
ncbi:dihydrolipoyl dehydrogenase [Buchnera aphidicola (Melanaphis sacchari)]|uniref:Dihydrolipoyl dehydrogenase n=1 Tax=Buchnera aphidicola (Melanaphis sacchari) TaxID=2173854 RepID=A0A2U8DH52_9GAMM|nr:dihydrolipoyl dehydrogenase [Buchnera aphidicola]AWH90564.1 dihydrolipoyl dehydrogenase [Buchnera aphidicola (Melanaphis sacchari)]